MKALVLCGGLPQIALINELKQRGIYTILADYNEHVIGRQYVDAFYPVSVFDIDQVKALAVQEKVDYVLTACADQVLMVQAKVSEELGLPCYIDYATAEAVSSKEFMKKRMLECSIPTSSCHVMDELDEYLLSDLHYPLIIKPVDSYSSRGVTRVDSRQELAAAFEKARGISRSHNVIVEEYVSGRELTVDAYIEAGTAHVLCISELDKIPGNDHFIICRTNYPAKISKEIEDQVRRIAQDVADAFALKDSPLLIQMILQEGRISVVELCARTGGGDKYLLIKKACGFDVIKAVVDLTLGLKPHVCTDYIKDSGVHILSEFLYCQKGIIASYCGFDELVEQKIITEFYPLRAIGSPVEAPRSSGDRAAYFILEKPDAESILHCHKTASERIRILDESGQDILRHDIIESFYQER